MCKVDKKGPDAQGRRESTEGREKERKEKERKVVRGRRVEGRERESEERKGKRKRASWGVREVGQEDISDLSHMTPP